MSLALSCVNRAKKVHLFVSLASSRIDSSLQRVVSGSEDRKLKTPGLLGSGKKVFNRMVAFGSTQAGSMALTGLPVEPATVTQGPPAGVVIPAGFVRAIP